LEFNIPFQHKYGYIRDDSVIEMGITYVARRLSPTLPTAADTITDVYKLVPNLQM